MPRVAKRDAAATLERIGRNLMDAAGRDGIASRKDVKDKVQELHDAGQHTEAKLTRQFFGFVDHRDYRPGARVTKGDVDRAVEYAKLHLLAKYDLNNNGYSKGEVEKMSRTGQLTVQLTRELKGIAAEPPTPPSSALGKLFAKAAENTWYISESDSQPQFISASFPASRALTAQAVMNAFQAHLVQAYDAENGDLSPYTSRLMSADESRAYLQRLATPLVDDDDGYIEMAAGFARIKKVLDDNLSDVRVLRVGPRDDRNPNELGVDRGAYQMLIVGRTRDGKLAGVAFESVET